MLRHIALLTAALIPVANAIAAEPQPTTVEKDGYRFQYRAALMPEGRVRHH